MTHYPYRVFFPGYPHQDNYDFIANSSVNYYYQSKLIINEQLSYSCLNVFDTVRKQIIQGKSDAWDQFTKLPYIKRSLAQEKELRFPVVFAPGPDVDRYDLRCGNGRLFIIMLFYPEVNIDAIITTPKQHNEYKKINSIVDLENILLAKTYFRNETIFRLSWSLEGDVIIANDVAVTDTWNFPFCKDSERNESLLNYVKDYIFKTAEHPMLSVLYHLSNLDIN